MIHPSINEGFGLPAFEAFGEGAPTAVHIGLPADYYLRGNSQVMTLDMTNQSQITNLLLNVDKFIYLFFRTKFSLICNKFLTKY